MMKNLPPAFIQQMESLIGKSRTDELIEVLNSEQPVTIRVNDNKHVVPKVLPHPAHVVPWCRQGRLLPTRPPFTFDPLLHAGYYYVQEASSMAIQQAVLQYAYQADCVLDLCAAPGGKSTLLTSSLNSNCVVVCNEIIRSRAQILAENMVKWGTPQVMVTNNASEDFADAVNAFDLILADVPCSGEGMFRKDDEAIENWSPENVQMCAERQRHLINNIWGTLKPGGILIYSTCTFNLEENEHNVAWIIQELGAQALPVSSLTDPHILGNLSGADFPVYHFMPHQRMCEGFFMAVLRKPEEPGFRPLYLPPMAEKVKDKKKDRKLGLPVQEILQTCKQWVFYPDNYDWQVTDEGVRALPLSMAPFYHWAQKQRLKIMEAGIHVATLKGKEPVPTHALAVSCAFNKEAFFCQEVDYAQAIAYLRKESIVLPPHAPKGYVLLTYRDAPIGFVKNVGNRANNLYPQEWRIRSTYIPEEFTVL